MRLHLSSVSDVYRRYAGDEKLAVAFVKDYRIGDSITVDVTTITVKDSASWEVFLRSINVNELTIELQRDAKKKGNISVSTAYRVKNHPEILPSRKTDEQLDLILFSYQDYTVFIFDVESKKQAHLIANYKRKDYINKF